MKKESKSTNKVKEVLGTKGAELFSALLLQEPRKADAIVYLQGDQLDRAPKTAELYNKEYADTIFITGNNNLIGRGKRNEENDFHLDISKEYFIKHGVKEEAILIDDKSMNSKDQAVTIIKLAKEKGWNTLLVVTSPFHILRAYLTLLKQVGEQDWNGEIIMQHPDLSWNSIPSGRVKTALVMLEEDLEKIKKYKDDIAEYKHNVTY
ncbi:MAG: YdcF family protein [Candidatus Pacebacteria bacterium]|mgnify:CR=1 FL=1|jgi:uncharacterized SAM-binding protein YcdF (DUF218 family)|nr:YdcF family protein [Candidatus Paceibacterota bacterium]MDP7466454.1 YdcF family protein [Candidatus Paceibacterota bacterium]